MPKTFLDWCIAVLISGVLLIGLFYTRFMPARYCVRCGSLLNRRKCSYADKPAEEVTCSNQACDVNYLETAHQRIDLHNG